MSGSSPQKKRLFVDYAVIVPKLCQSYSYAPTKPIDQRSSAEKLEMTYETAKALCKSPDLRGTPLRIAHRGKSTDCGKVLDAFIDNDSLIYMYGIDPDEGPHTRYVADLIQRDDLYIDNVSLTHAHDSMDPSKVQHIELSLCANNGARPGSGLVRLGKRKGAEDLLAKHYGQQRLEQEEQQNYSPTMIQCAASEEMAVDNPSSSLRFPSLTLHLPDSDNKMSESLAQANATLAAPPQQQQQQQQPPPPPPTAVKKSVNKKNKNKNNKPPSFYEQKNEENNHQSDNEMSGDDGDGDDSDEDHGDNIGFNNASVDRSPSSEQTAIAKWEKIAEEVGQQIKLFDEGKRPADAKPDDDKTSYLITHLPKYIPVAMRRAIASALTEKSEEADKARYGTAKTLHYQRALIDPWLKAKGKNANLPLSPELLKRLEGHMAQLQQEPEMQQYMMTVAASEDKINEGGEGMDDSQMLDTSPGPSQLPPSASSLSTSTTFSSPNPSQLLPSRVEHHHNNNNTHPHPSPPHPPSSSAAHGMSFDQQLALINAQKELQLAEIQKLNIQKKLTRQQRRPFDQDGITEDVERYKQRRLLYGGGPGASQQISRAALQQQQQQQQQHQQYQQYQLQPPSPHQARSPTEFGQQMAEHLKRQNEHRQLTEYMRKQKEAANKLNLKVYGTDWAQYFDPSKTLFKDGIKEHGVPDVIPNPFAVSLGYDNQKYWAPPLPEDRTVRNSVPGMMTVAASEEAMNIPDIMQSVVKGNPFSYDLEMGVAVWGPADPMQAIRQVQVVPMRPFPLDQRDPKSEILDYRDSWASICQNKIMDATYRPDDVNGIKHHSTYNPFNNQQYLDSFEAEERRLQDHKVDIWESIGGVRQY